MSSHPQTKNAILEIASFPNNKKEEKASEEKVLKRTKIDFGDVPAIKNFWWLTGSLTKKSTGCELVPLL